MTLRPEFSVDSPSLLGHRRIAIGDMYIVPNNSMNWNESSGKTLHYTSMLPLVVEWFSRSRSIHHRLCRFRETVRYGSNAATDFYAMVCSVLCWFFLWRSFCHCVYDRWVYLLTVDCTVSYIDNNIPRKFPKAAKRQIATRYMSRVKERLRPLLHLDAQIVFSSWLTFKSSSIFRLSQHHLPN